MLRRLKLLKRLQEVHLSPEAGLALLQRVETNSDSAEDRDILIKVIRATQAAQQFVEASPRPVQPSPERKAKRKRQWTKAARRRNRREGGQWLSYHPHCYRWAGHRCLPASPVALTCCGVAPGVGRDEATAKHHAEYCRR